MPNTAERNPYAMVACVFAGFAAGPALGIAVAQRVAPGSEIAQLVGPAAFTAVFVAGFVLWFGLGVFSMLARALGRALRGSAPAHARSSAAVAIPPGHGAFLSLGLVFGGAAGVVVGLLPQATSFLAAFAAHLVAGGAYGAALRGLARRGYLPFPEPE